MTAEEIRIAGELALEDAARGVGRPLTDDERERVLEHAVVLVDRADWDAHTGRPPRLETPADHTGRRLYLRAKERAAGVESWCRLSFVKDGKFQGCVMLRAFGVVDAIALAWHKGINPGGQVQVVVAEPGWGPRVEGYADRLLTREEAEAFDAAHEAAVRGSV